MVNDNRVFRRGGAAALTALAIMCSAIPAEAVPRLAPGVYKGVVTDPAGDPGSYAITIRITASRFRPRRSAGRVSYRAAENLQTGEYALKCKGMLSFRGRKGAKFRFRENIDGGADRECVTGGTVTLTRESPRKLTYRWTKPGMNRPAPTGTLTR